MTFTDISIAIAIIAVLYIIIAFIRTWWKFHENIKIIKAAIINFDIEDPNYGLSECSILQNIVDSYNISFTGKKTDRNANDFFDIDNINTSNFNLGYFSGYNNRLIGLGILFTFLGLTIGVGYFGYNLEKAGSNNQSKAISDGINVLMGGMGTAFLSSVFGMVLSLWFSFIYKKNTNIVDAGLKQIANELNSSFLKTPTDYALESESRMLKLLKESMITYKDENDNTIGLGTMTKELVIQSKKQSDSLHTFSNDLADAFYNALNKDGEENGSLVSVLRSGFDTLNNTNHEGFEKLLASDKDPINDLVENLLAELKLTFSKMTDDITKSIESVINGVAQQAGGQVVEQADEAAAQLGIVTDQIAVLPGIIEKINEQATESADYTQGMITKVNEAIDKLHGIIELQSLAAEEIKDATTIYADKRTEMNSSLESIKMTSRTLNESLHKLDEGFDKYTEHTSDLEEQRINSLADIVEIVETTSNMNNNLVENLETIENNVATIFDNISQGLNGYHDQISNNTSKELAAYSDSVVKITNGLHSIVSALNASIEDLDDKLGKR